MGLRKNGLGLGLHDLLFLLLREFPSSLRRGLGRLDIILRLDHPGFCLHSLLPMFFELLPCRDRGLRRLISLGTFCLRKHRRLFSLGSCGRRFDRLPCGGRLLHRSLCQQFRLIERELCLDHLIVRICRPLPDILHLAHLSLESISCRLGRRGGTTHGILRLLHGILRVIRLLLRRTGSALGFQSGREVPLRQPDPPLGAGLRRIGIELGRLDRPLQAPGFILGLLHLGKSGGLEGGIALRRDLLPCLQERGGGLPGLLLGGERLLLGFGDGLLRLLGQFGRVD